VPSFVVRVWLPDRPGALGAVASRIGAVRGDLTGIDILERGAGRAIDELVVSLPSSDLIDLMLRELRAVDGVDVEDIRQVAAPVPDPRLDALESAAMLVEQTTAGDLVELLVEHASRDLEASWAAVVDHGSVDVLAVVGDAPSPMWLAAFVAGSLASDAAGTDDVAWASFPHAPLALVLGRAGRPFRQRERSQLEALTRIADRRWAELLLPRPARS
jgi:hypothetical protein